MKLSIFCLVAAFSLFSVAYGEGNVVVLTPENFDSIVDGSKDALIEFYAPWVINIYVHIICNITVRSL